MKPVAIRIPFVVAITLGLALVAGCSSESQAPADTQEARAELAGSIAALEIAGGSYEQTLDLGADLALDSSADALSDQIGRELTDEERLRVRQVMREALADILSQEAFRAAVVSAYTNRFTAAELQSISTFFASPAGASLLGRQAELTDEIGTAMEALVDANVEQFVAAVDAGIAREFPDTGAETAR